MADNVAVNTGQRQYNNPVGGDASTVGSQFRTDHYYKKALIDAAKDQYFMQLADVRGMPKHMGKTIKQYHYVPLLDDRNVNDQGIDASGAVIDNGNLWGSSKDVGTISNKLPALTETGGRVNRVGFKRLELEGSIEKFGFFDEYTQDSLDFDTDEQLEMHINREMITGASQITEAALQVDLLNAAGVVRYAGEATATDEITGEGEAPSVVTYEDLMKLAITLFDNRTPKHTQVITGTRMIDTRVINSAMYMYVGSEMVPTIRKMKDHFGNQAFISVEHYAAAGNVARGEIGTLGDFRIIQVPEMQHWAEAGADETEGENPGFRATNGKYDVFPMLVIGDRSFTTIGFQTDGKTVKFKVYHKKPGEQTADRFDPYGETGFMSIKWWYGFMVLRPERIAVVKTIAEA